MVAGVVPIAAGRVGSRYGAALATCRNRRRGLDRPPGDRARRGRAAPAIAPWRQAMLTRADQHVQAKTPYQWGGGHPGIVSWGVDCSGLVIDCAKAAGFVLEWNSGSMWQLLPRVTDAAACGRGPVRLQRQGRARDADRAVVRSRGKGCLHRRAGRGRFDHNPGNRGPDERVRAPGARPPLRQALSRFLQPCRHRRGARERQGVRGVRVRRLKRGVVRPPRVGVPSGP